MAVDCETFPTSLKCNVEVVNLSQSGTQSIQNASTTFSAKDSILVLGRDSFNDLVLLIELKKDSKKYHLSKNVKFYTSCVKEGKACLEINGKNRILISNAAPQLLISFLNTVALKNKKTYHTEGFVASANHRLYNGVAGSGFNEISPLTTHEIDSFGSRVRKQSTLDNSSDAMDTPKRVLKRKNVEIDSQKEDNASCSSLQPQFAPRRRLSSDKCLNEEQRYIANWVLQGRNVFFTGSAGTGKSFLLKKLIEYLPPDTTMVTASTGMAACQISGTTFHSFAGIGTGLESAEACVKKVLDKNSVVKNYRKCRVLIVDEISMIDADFFDKVEFVARNVRANDKPFGGIQLVLCGDFLQLPPVSKVGDDLMKKFCFEAESWFNCVGNGGEGQGISIELKTVKRQSDQKFIKILQLMRIGQLCDSHREILMSTSNQIIEKNGIKSTILCTHKEHAAIINKEKLDQLPSSVGTSQVYKSVDVGDKTKLNCLTNAPERLVLKVGAQVMLTKNLSVCQGLVNGARGVVTGFDGKRKDYPTVKFVSGVERTVEPSKWVVKSGLGGGEMARTQIPLQLAWAISIHKSQGMTLDCVSVSLSKVFECGQAYVALSRAKSLETLRVIDLGENSVRANPKVVQFYVNMRRKNCDIGETMAGSEMMSVKSNGLKRTKTM